MSLLQRGRFTWLVDVRFLRWVLLVSVSIVSFAALILPIAIRPSSYPLQVGAVANQDIQAPQSLTFTSTLLTEQAHKEAELNVNKIYLPADPTIARNQIERLRIVLNYLTSIRLDIYSNNEQKTGDMTSISDVNLTTALAEQILELSDSRWEAVQQESLSVLEQVMRNTIREDGVIEARRNLPSLVSFTFPPDQASIVVGIVAQFVTANSLYSTELTDEAIQKAREAVTSVERRFVTGQTIVQRGQIITPLIWEALNEFGLIQPQRESHKMIASGVLVFIVGGFIAVYFNRRRSGLMRNLRSLLVISILFILFIYGARLLIPNRTVIPYLFPIAAFGMTIAGFFSIEVGLVFTLAMSVLAAYGLTNTLDLTVFYIMTSLFSVLVLGKGRRLASFFWSGIAIGFAGSAVILAYRLPDTITDWIGIATLIVSSFANGLGAASLTLLLQYLFSQYLGITPAIQLMEIARPDHPMLQYMLRYAPGSYQHSLQVANLAEQAAEIIGADAMLVRVGAIYHDVGKAANPSFFIENQVPGNLNPHDDLDPQISAATIIRHVADGVQLSRKFRLPPRIQDFIREHHGTLLTRYQYTKAVQAAGGNPAEVDTELYRYPGPRPQSKETALLMLADGCEARARAELPRTDEELREIIKKVFDYCQGEGQLDDTSLTLRDLTIAKESFLSTLKNIYHPRIQYPELQSITSLKEKAAAMVPTSPVSKTD